MNELGENNGKFLEWVKLALRCGVNGIWMLFQVIQKRLTNNDLSIWIGIVLISLIGTFTNWDNNNLLYDSFFGTWFSLYTVLNGLWFLYREWTIHRIEGDLKERVKGVEKITRLFREDDSIQQEYKIPNTEKKWTNDEAFAYYKTAYPKLLTLTNELTPNIHNNLYALKDYIREQKEAFSDTRTRYEDIKTVHPYYANKHVQKWIRKASPYITTSTQLFFDETMELVDRFQKERDRNRRGVLGELIVQDYLKSYCEEFMPLYNTRFQSDEGTVENDALLFTARGIFSLEIKNINSTGRQKIKITRDGQWYDWRKDGWERSNHNKIFDQVNRHTVLTEKKLAEFFSNLIDIEIRPLIVIPNDNVEIINESHFEIVRPSQIPVYIRNQPLRNSHEQGFKMREFIQEQDMGQGTFSFLDVESYEKEIQKRVAFIRSLEKVSKTTNEIHGFYEKEARNRTLRPLIYLRQNNMLVK
jgi:hypothetical protein